MFRGEPLALWTMIFGFLSFLILQVIGLFITGIIPSDLRNLTSVHFNLVFFGWIGFIILGAHLQFFRAITGLRKYGPNFLRYAYHITLLTGLFGILIGNLNKNYFLVQFGYIIYFSGLLIHTYWIGKQTLTKFFKFPLDYFAASHSFLLISFLLIILNNYQNQTNFTVPGFVRHILVVGWISLTVQGAMIRILPMFLGKNINRQMRPHLPQFFLYSLFSSILFSISFSINNLLFTLLSGILWIISWLLTILLLVRSITPENIEYKQTLLLFIPGVFWTAFGSIIGFYLAIFPGNYLGMNLRAVHIHLSLLAGLSMIMLGAFHRIHTFQIYTLLYTGKRQISIRLGDLLRLKLFTTFAILMNISVILMVFGFVKNDFNLVGIGGILVFSSTLLFSLIILLNLIHYWQNKADAVPFWLKPKEYKKPI